MKLSRKSEYACLALIELANRRDDGYVRIEDIASSRCIPRRYLERILLQLRRGGYLKSARGAGGGYRLARDPERITLAEILRLMDGALAPGDCDGEYFYEKTPAKAEAKLAAVFRELRRSVAEKLETTTLADLV